MSLNGLTNNSSIAHHRFDLQSQRLSIHSDKKTIDADSDDGPHFQDTVPLDSPSSMDDHPPENLRLDDTEVVYDSDCGGVDDRGRNNKSFEDKDEIVLDSEDEDEEIDGRRVVTAMPESPNALKTNSERFGKFGDESRSQTEDWSQTDALDFVDRFVADNKADLSQEICCRMTFKERSRTVLGLNGPQNLARKINRRAQAKGQGPFEWFSSEGGTAGVEPNVVLCTNEETGSGLDGKQLEDNNVVRDSPDDYDIGFATQLAAEAIQALACEDPFGYKAGEACGAVGSTVDESSRALSQQDSRLMSVCNDLGEAFCSANRKKRSERKFGSCVAKRGVAITEKDTTPLTEAETSSPVNVQTERRFEKVYSRVRRCRQPSSGVSLITTEDHQASEVGEKMDSKVEHSIIVYERKRRRVNANPCEVTQIDGCSKLCDSRDGARESKLTAFSNLGIWNFPRSKRTKTITVTGKNAASFDHACYSNKKRTNNKRATKKPTSNQPITHGVPESIPEFTQKTFRRRKDISNVRILLSQHLDDDVIKHQKKVAARLGVTIVLCCKDATHFVVDKFARTRNMLEAIALGKPVVTCHWLSNCGEANCFIEERNYILRDAKKEKELGFCLPVSLARANRNPLLKDQRVLVTRNVKPNREMIMNLVKAVHGKLVEEVQASTLDEKDIAEKLLILSCEEDHQTCLPFLHKGVAIYSTELLLNGIVTQKLEYKRHKLFANEVKYT